MVNRKKIDLYIKKQLNKKVIWCFRYKILSYILLPFCFRYALFYHKSEHKNLLEFIIYSIEALVISELCFNQNFGFPNTISVFNELSEQFLILQFMLFNLFRRVFLMFTKLLQWKKKCAVNSTSKLNIEDYAILKIMIKRMSI